MNYSELGRINLVLNNDGTEVFRQKRFSEDDIILKLKVKDETFIISNWSRTGLNFQAPAPIFSIKDHLEEVQVLANEHLIYTGTVQIKSKSEDEVGIHYGAGFLYKLFPIEAVEAIKYVDNFVSHVQQANEKFASVNPEVCKIILEMKHSLSTLQSQSKDYEFKIRDFGYDDRMIAESHYLEKMSAAVNQIMVGFNKKVNDILDMDLVEPNSEYHLLFDENIYPFFVGADNGRRAKEKPLGYAGDFEMMNQIYRGAFEGKDLFGKLLHHYTTTELSAQSVLFRKPYFCGHYKRILKERGEKKVNILSLASGPCVEFQSLIEELTQEELSRINLTLLDLDPMSLEHAQSKIYEQCLRHDKTVNIKFIRTSVKVFMEGASPFKDDFDLIYSGGLFDYLDNQVSTSIITNLYKLLGDGGRLSIGNFTKDNSTKAFCHLITDWHLIHKTEEEIRDWARYTDCKKITVDYDIHNINAFLVLER